MLEVRPRRSVRQGIPEIVDSQSLLTGFPEEAHSQERSLEATRCSVDEPTCPIRPGLRCNDVNHQRSTWTLDQHSGNTEGTNQFGSICVQKLGQVLDESERGGA